MLLGEIAHVRTGDKGDISQISVIAYDPKDYPLLCECVTVERVLTHFRNLEVRHARRYEVEGIAALNFVLEGALKGGVTRALALDAHGKTLGAQLLDMELLQNDGPST